MSDSCNNRMAAKISVPEWEKKFKAADKDNSGCLSIHELRDLLRANGSKLTDSQIANYFLRCDGLHGDRKISLDEFLKGQREIEEYIGKVTTLFNQHDSDKSGFIDKNELKKIMLACNPKFTDADVDCVMKEADKTQDGKICLEEFLSACT